MDRILILNEFIDSSHINAVQNAVAAVANAISALDAEIDDINVAPTVLNTTGARAKYFYEHTINELSDQKFQEHFRMTRTTMQMLIEYLRVKSKIRTDMMLVPFEKKIYITVWALANSCTFRELGNLFDVHKSTANFIFLEICNLIAECRCDFIKWPSEIEQIAISAAIEHTHKMPNCVGAVDGCHIEIRAPSANPTDYYNRKQSHSVLLQAVSDHTLRFTDIYIGHTGRAHDARIFRESPLGEQLPHFIKDRKYHIIGDSAYSLKVHLLTPFRDNGHLNDRQKKYNKTLASARSCIERAFALLKGKFRRLKYLDMNETEYITIVMCAACVLHNFILSLEKVQEQTIKLENVEAVDDADYENMERVDAAAVTKRLHICNSLI